MGKQQNLQKKIALFTDQLHLYDAWRIITQCNQRKLPHDNQFHLIAGVFAITLRDLAKILHIGKSTLHVYAKNIPQQELSKNLIEHLMCLENLAFVGYKTFKDKPLDFINWLNCPNDELDDQIPFSMLVTSTGTNIVHQVLLEKN